VSSGAEDEGADAEDAGQPTTVTRAGRPSRRPSLLRVSANTSDSGAGTSPERRAAAATDGGPLQHAAAGGAVPGAGGAPLRPRGSSPDASGPGGGLYSGLGGGHGSGAGWQQQQQQQQQRATGTPSAFQRALAMSRRHSTVLPDELHTGAQLRARRSASMSQMQVWRPGVVPLHCPPRAAALFPPALGTLAPPGREMQVLRC
jgi:hypothetical protein